MRIIGGELKGKKILFLKSKITRPLRNFVKENIFNIIENSNKINISLSNANVLDLYSGIGSFGIECISRKAKKVTFVEKDFTAERTLKTNIKNLSIAEKSIIFLNYTIDAINKIRNEKFDLIFLDPPFAENKFIQDLSLIKKNKIYNKKHLIIIHREKKENLISNMIEIIMTKEYGRSKIIFAKFI